MKKAAVIAFMICVSTSTGLLLANCGGKQQNQMESTDHAHASDSTVVYACPMHPEITGKEGDTCSKCGMKLEKVEVSDSTATQNR